MNSGAYESNSIQPEYQISNPADETVTSAKPAVESDAAMLTVTVPDSATVTVNGHETSSEGEVRQFMSRGLKAGFVYTYVVKASFDLDGETKTESKSVKLRAGEIQEVEFSMPVAQVETEAQPETDVAPDADTTTDAESEAAAAKTDDSPITVVKLHVPAEAKVQLAGNPTRGSGAVRTFRTKQLKSGQSWQDYTVRVVADVNGQPIALERTINVDAGSQHELNFDFDSQTVASL